MIHAVEFDAPRLESGQALVEVVAAPINPADLLTLTGEYGHLPPLPAGGGREGVGRVAELGVDTPGPEVGQADWVAEATGGATIRLGIDAVGGTATGRLADCLGRDATLVGYGRMSGEPCAVQPDAFVVRNLTMRGFWLASWVRQTAEHDRAARARRGDRRARRDGQAVRADPRDLRRQ